MSVVGTLGSVIFEVSDRKALVIQSLSKNNKGRWTTHNVLRGKPKAEFLGPELQSVTLTAYLSANLGIKPQQILQKLRKMAENGEAHMLVIGGKPVSSRPFRVISTSEEWDTVMAGGELIKATVSVNLEEYA